MNLFGYGSLMDNNLLKSTVPDATIIGPTLLKGYKRIFDLKSPHRHNEETNVFSSVLNIKKDENYSIQGVLIDLSDNNLKDLLYRERGYKMACIAVGDDIQANTFIATDHKSYSYIYNDPAQEEYLSICINAAKSFGDDFLENFISTTFIEGKTIKELGLY